MTFNLLGILKNSADDLRRFPVMLVPLLAASIVLFFMLTLLAGAGVITSDSALELGDTSYTLLFIASLLVTIAVEFVAFGVLVCLAYDVVISQVGDLVGSFRRFRERLTPFLLVAIAIAAAGAAVGAVVVFLAGILGSLTIVVAAVPVLLLLLLALFSFIAVVYEEAGSMEAITAAWSLVFSNLAAMLVYALAMFLIFMVLGMISSILALTPVIGNIIGSLLIAAYYSLAVDAGMRIYRQLST